MSETLKASMVALLLPPSRSLVNIRTRGLPGPAAAFAINHLLFKLMLGMGLQKFYKNDNTYWAKNLYIPNFMEWQPFPTPIGYYVHQVLVNAPYAAEMRKLVQRMVWVGQIVLPFGIHFPVKAVRIVCAVFCILEQVCIGACGNYGTFNAITIALCLPSLFGASFYDTPALPTKPATATATAGMLHTSLRTAEYYLLELLAGCSIIGGTFYILRFLALGSDHATCIWCTCFDRNVQSRMPFCSHACSLEASMRVTNGIPLGCSPPLTVWHCICRPNTERAQCTNLDL
jgi:hypothetical protein